MIAVTVGRETFEVVRTMDGEGHVYLARVDSRVYGRTYTDAQIADIIQGELLRPIEYPVPIKNAPTEQLLPTPTITAEQIREARNAR